MAKKTAEAVESGRRIRFRMGEESQAVVAGRMGWESSRLGNYIQGTRKLNVRDARAIGSTINSHPAYLLGVVDEVDEALLSLTEEQKKSVLAMLGINIPPSPPATSVSVEARSPRRTTKSGVRTGARAPKKKKAA